MENSNTLCSEVMIPYLVLTARKIVLNGSCLPAASRAALVIHHLRLRQAAPPVQVGIAVRVINDAIPGSSPDQLEMIPVLSIRRAMCFASVSDMMFTALLKAAH